MRDKRLKIKDLFQSNEEIYHHIDPADAGRYGIGSTDGAARAKELVHFAES